MFGSNLQLPNSITTYAAAVAKFNSIKPIRGRSTDVRPLGNRRNDSLTIRMEGDSVFVRLYQTDIIGYRSDGTIELEPYASALTNSAVHSILGRKVSPMYTNALGPMLGIGSRIYRVPNYAVLDKDFNLIEGSEPIVKYHVDRAKANAAVKLGFKQFELWVKTQLRLGIDPRGDNKGYVYGSQSSLNNVARFLDDPDRYSDIVRGWPYWVSIEQQLRKLRVAVLKYHDCITETSLPYVVGYSELRSVADSHSRLG